MNGPSLRAPIPGRAGLVSVVLPVFNGRDFLSQAVESVLAQTYADWELIVVDDGSTDDSAALAEAHTRAHPERVHLLRLGRNRGVSEARNRGCAAAKGEYLAFLDADDAWAPEKLARQVAALQAAGPEVGAVHTGVRALASPAIERWLAALHEPLPLEVWEDFFNGSLRESLQQAGGSYTRLLGWSCPICASSVLLRRSVFETIGGFETDLVYQMEDWCLWLAVSLLTGWSFLEEPLTHYRLHPQSYTARVYLREAAMGCGQAGGGLYSHRIARGEALDRCLAFARRNNLPLSYSDFPPPPVRPLAQDAAPPEDGPPPALRQLILFVTSACDLSCEHCFYADNLNQGRDLPLSAIGRIAETCPQGESIVLTGGEPFSRKDLCEVVALFQQRHPRATVSINTNGTRPTRIERETRAMLARQPGVALEITISLDGFEASHNALRRNPRSFRSALTTLRLLESLREEHPSLRLSVNTTVRPENLPEVAAFGQEVAAGFDLDYHSFELERGSPRVRDRFRLARGPLLATYRELLALVRRRYPAAAADSESRFHTQLRNLLEGEAWPFPCVAGRKSIVIYDDGMLAPCELRSRKFDLRRNGFDVAQALASDEMRGEVAAIAREKCFCTHGCWTYWSMVDATQGGSNVRSLSLSG